jgi:hypothetical protein
LFKTGHLVSQLDRRGAKRKLRSLRALRQTAKEEAFCLRFSTPADFRSPLSNFTCPECSQNAWAKADALLICGACYDEGDGDIFVMVAETGGED